MSVKELDTVHADALSLAKKRGFSRETVEELSYLKDEPEWVRRRRLTAWEAYEAKPMPKWRRTSLRKLDLDAFAPYYPPSEGETDLSKLPAELQHAIARDSERAGLFIHRNSGSVIVQLDQEWAEQGVILTDLDTAIREYPDLVEPHLMGEAISLVGTGHHDQTKFEALNGALWSGGMFLYVPEDVWIDKPIQGVFWADVPGLAIFPHTLIVTGPNSGVTYLEEGRSAGGEGEIFVNGITEIYPQPGSQVSFLNIQAWADNVLSFSSRRAVTQPDSVIKWTIGAIGADLSREFVESRLAGAGSSTEIVGVFFLDGQQHNDTYTLMNHVAPFTSGDLLFKGALQDRSRSVFEGLIKIHPGAQNVASYLHEKTLVLSPDARADSIPSLEIEANDVRASHGATVSKIDPEQLFYLMAHGLPESEARRLIVNGFFEPVLERIPLESVREHLRTEISEKVK
ncbi:MAG: Fe-S cluster assembly protein SufD [Chloroflexi bacterium]|nr:MAG: Fe-S cluster assembly protein SufD [Chloroflexota bacterium]